MLKSFVHLAVATMTAATALEAQLYVIAGTPPGNRPINYAAKLVRIDDDGTVAEVESLAEGPTPTMKYGGGLSRVSISQELRVAVIALQGPDRPMRILDLDKAAIVKRCDSTPVSPMSLINQNLAELPDGRIVLMEDLFRGPEEKLAGILLDPAIPCQDGLVEMAPTDILDIRVAGWPGETGIGTGDSMEVDLESDGRLDFHLLDVSLPFRVPNGPLAVARRPYVHIIGANSRLFTISVYDGTGDTRVLVYRKRDKTWHKLSIPPLGRAGDGQEMPSPRLTIFGDFLAQTEVQPRGPDYLRSAGKAGWRTAKTETGPNMVEYLEDEFYAYPGRLHLYDMEHERSYTIPTGQADSEILLVEDGAVYYRVTSAIYRASIGEASLGTPQLVAKSAILGDAHWAFIRH